MEIKSERLTVELKKEQIAGFYSMSIYPNADNADSDTLEKVLENSELSLVSLNKQFADVMDDKTKYKAFVVYLCAVVEKTVSITSIVPFSYGEVFGITDYRANLTQICFFEEDLTNCNMESRLLALDVRYNGRITPLTLITFEALALVRRQLDH